MTAIRSACTTKRGDPFEVMGRISKRGIDCIRTGQRGQRLPAWISERYA